MNFIEFVNSFNNIDESVINKISDLFLVSNADELLFKFKKIFNIFDDIKIIKINIGGSFDLNNNIIEYSSLNTLLHDLLHFLQKNNFDKIKYINPILTDCGILEYILQPNELNNWAISLSAWSLQYNNFGDFLKIAKKFNNFEELNKEDRIKHILYLLLNFESYNCNTRKKYINKLLNLSKQYNLVIKQLQTKKISDFKTEKIIDL